MTDTIAARIARLKRANPRWRIARTPDGMCLAEHRDSGQRIASANIGDFERRMGLAGQGRLALAGAQPPERAERHE
jgi:hypothetical protein